MRHGRIDCRTGRRLATRQDAEEHARVCPAYAREREENLASPPECKRHKLERDKEEERQWRRTMSRLRGEYPELDVL